MKMRLKLSTKIFFLSFLNLLLLGLVFFVFMRIQFRLGIESFLASPVQDRALAVAREIALELRDTDAANWDGILARYGESYHVEFFLVDNQGNRIAGSQQPLPGRIVGEVREMGDLRRRQRPHRPEPAAESTKVRGGGQERPQGFLRASANPTRYWIGIRIPLPGRDDSDAILIAGATSWKSSALFFDPKPWLAVGAAVLAISVLCWLPLVRGLNRSITRMTRATAQIAEGQFDVQLPVRRRDELGQLSASVNRMAVRLASFVKGQKRFLGDVAHELCSPIARIQVALGILERSATPEQQPSLADLREDIQQMSALVHEVLSFSKAGLRPEATQLAPVAVAETVARVLEREAAGARVASSVSGGLRAVADPELLFRALSNVLRNAIRYAGSAGPISVSAAAEDGMVVIRVGDCGPGLPEKDIEAVFQPFYRLESARDRESGGVGLGLAIVKTCIEACHGSVACRNRQPSGLEVEIRLKPA